MLSAFCFLLQWHTATKLAEALGMSEEEVRFIGLSAVLHDIGKNVPELLPVFNLAREFNDAERAFAENHTWVGVAMLQQNGVSEAIQDMALLHHPK